MKGKTLLGVALLSVTAFMLSTSQAASENMKPATRQAAETLQNRARSTRQSDIVIDEGKPEEITISAQDEKVYEPALLPQYKDYAQSDALNLSLSKHGLTQAYSTQTHHNTPYPGYLSNDQKIMIPVVLSTYLVGTPIPDMTSTVLTKVDPNTGNQIGIKPLSKEPVDYNNYNRDTMFSGGSGLMVRGVGKSQIFMTTYEFGGGSRQMVVEVTDDLLVTSRKPVDINPADHLNQSLNRTSVGYDNKAYMGTFFRAYNNVNNQLPVLEVDLDTMAAETSKRRLLKVKSFETVTGEPFETVGAVSPLIAMVTNGMDTAPNGDMIGIVTYEREGVGVPGGSRYLMNRWDKDGNIVQEILTDGGDKPSLLRLIGNISTATEKYFLRITNDGAERGLFKYDTETRQTTQVMEYPAGTSAITFKFEKIPNSTDYYMYGTVNKFTGIFQGFGNPGETKLAIARLDENFKILSFAGVNSEYNFDPASMVSVSENQVAVPGRIDGPDKILVDKVWGGNYVTEKLHPNLRNTHTAYLNLDIVNDYAPAIKAPKPFVIDIDDPDVQAGNKKMDDWLLSGSNKKGQDITGPNGVKVYDQYDLNQALEDFDMEYLQKRVNRNYLKQDNPIDWKKLGFDPSERGPQKVTYFVTDSQQKTSSDQTVVNKIDDETILYPDPDNPTYALAHSNVYMNVNETASLMEDKIIDSANMLYWELETGDTEANFKVDPTDFNKLKQAKAKYDLLGKYDDKSQILKPYPIKVTGKGKKAGQPEVSTVVWVFVGDNQTTLDTEKNVVMYANNYKLPFHEAQVHTGQKLLQAAQPRIYDFKTTEKNATELTPIADKNTPANQFTFDLTGLTSLTQNSDKDDINVPVTYKDSVLNVSVDVYQTKVDLTIKFVDKDGEVAQVFNEITGNYEAVEDVVIKNALYQDVINLKTNPEIQTKIDKILEDDVSLYDKTYKAPPNETAYTVPKDNATLSYIFSGRLKFESVTSTLSLEKGWILPTTQVLEYESTTDDFEVKIRDSRQHSGTLDNPATGYRGDFHLKVEMTSPFTHTVSQDELEGAILQYKGADIPVGQSTEIKSSRQDSSNKKKNLFNFVLDKKNEDSDGWSLIVPSNNVQKGQYEADLTWVLEEGP